MFKLMQKLPSPHSLVVFESAARNGSFKLAAEELNVTQPSISYAIHQLESFLNVQLFKRHHRGVHLTLEGDQLYKDVYTALFTVEQSFSKIRNQRQKNKVSISVSTTLANYWLLPRIYLFKQKHPNVDISFLTTQRDINPDEENVDLTIKLDNKDLSGKNIWHFADEEIFAICSPKYINDKGSLIKNIYDLSKENLLFLREPYRKRIGWNQWFNNLGYKDITVKPGTTFNDYQILLQSVIDGHGIALGHRHIVGNLIKRNLLIKPLDQTLCTDKSFFLIGSKYNPLSKSVLDLKNWMLKESAKHC